MALEGTLCDMSLIELLHVFRMGSKTGVLLLACASSRAIVYVAAGTLIDAAVVRLPDRTVVAAQDEAVIQMLLWDDATFIFRHDPAVVQRPVRIRHDAEYLILESMKRRQNLQAALPHHIVTLDTRLQLSPLDFGSENGVSLTMEQRRILSRIPDLQVVRAISAATGIPPDQTIRLVLELMAIGLIEIVPARRPASPSAHRREMFATKTEEPATIPQLMMQPGSHAQPVAHERRKPVRRSLIDAVMRRVRAL